MKLVLIIPLFVFVQCSLAQQESIPNQFWNYLPHVNPAFTGLEHEVQVGLLYRHQWTNVPNAPRDLHGFINSRAGDKSAIGLNSRIGSVGNSQSFNISIPMSYRLTFRDSSNLAFGTAVGIHSVQADDFISSSLVDDSLVPEELNTQNLISHVGVAYKIKAYTIGIGFRNLELANFERGDIGFQFRPTFYGNLRLTVPVGSRSQYNVHSKMMLELLYATDAISNFAQINLRVLAKDKLSFVVGAAPGNHWIFAAGWDFKKKLRTVYSIELSRNKVNSEGTSISHEFSLIYQLRDKEFWQ